MNSTQTRQKTLPMEATVTFTIRVQEDCTQAQLRDFIRFELGDVGGIEMENPLSGYDLQSCEIEINSIS